MMKLRVSHNDCDVADLLFTKPLSHAAQACAPSVVSINSRFNDQRREDEEFIRTVFQQKYNARVSVDYPNLMSVRDDSGHIQAAAGFRSAAGSRLYLETYLDRPIEAAIAAATGGASMPRSAIVEVGNLASTGCGAAAVLFAALAAYLDLEGFQVVTATGTKALARQFRSAGIRTRVLAPATSDAIGGAVRDWGTYYDTEPHVMVGGIATGVNALRSLYGARYMPRSPTLPAYLCCPDPTALFGAAHA